MPQAERAKVMEQAVAQAANAQLNYFHQQPARTGGYQTVPIGGMSEEADSKKRPGGRFFIQGIGPSCASRECGNRSRRNGYPIQV